MRIWDLPKKDQEKVTNIVRGHLDAIWDEINKQFPDLNQGDVCLMICEAVE